MEVLDRAVRQSSQEKEECRSRPGRHSARLAWPYLKSAKSGKLDQYERGEGGLEDSRSKGNPPGFARHQHRADAGHESRGGYQLRARGRTENLGRDGQHLR